MITNWIWLFVRWFLIKANFSYRSLCYSVGISGNLEAETLALLLEHGVDYQPFPPSVLDNLPKLPWTIPAEEISKRRDYRCVPIQYSHRWSLMMKHLGLGTIAFSRLIHLMLATSMMRFVLDSWKRMKMDPSCIKCQCISLTLVFSSKRIRLWMKWLQNGQLVHI